MIKDSNDVNRGSLDLANKVKKHKIYVCVYIKKKKKYRSKTIDHHHLAQERKQTLRTHT